MFTESTRRSGATGPSPGLSTKHPRELHRPPNDGAGMGRGERCLHRLIVREELDRAAGQTRPERLARLPEDLTVHHGDRRKDRSR
jgi:hypothetical protein